MAQLAVAVYAKVEPLAIPPRFLPSLSGFRGGTKNVGPRMLKRVRKELITRRKDCPRAPALFLLEDSSDDTRVVTRSGDVIKVPAMYPFNAPTIREMPGLEQFRVNMQRIDFWTWIILIAPHPVLSYMWPVYADGQCLCCISPLCDWLPTKRLEDVAAYMHFLRRVHSNVRYGWIARAVFPARMPDHIVELIMSFVVNRDSRFTTTRTARTTQGRPASLLDSGS